MNKSLVIEDPKRNPSVGYCDWKIVLEKVLIKKGFNKNNLMCFVKKRIII